MAPLFEYICEDGHITTAIVKHDNRDAPATCEKISLLSAAECSDDPCPVEEKHKCNKPLKKIMSAPSAFPGASNWSK